jgi:chromosome segregation protein
LEINSLNYENEAFNLIENKNNVIELKIKLSEIGSVNFLALEEYEEQNNRLIFTQNQINDLLEAEKTLIETINEINQKAEQNFSETFEKVRENFKYLFTKLFNEEGFADLKLSDGNLLESDIEITAKPPGKKPHSIEMLSGGEKTLTAIALLFAIYMVKPSPFCILDEVDAPLDDANIGRFINMIRQFTDKTQFLIVTHNKKTMEAADTLYGITQQETGLSTIVSVRFGEESIEKLNQN